MIKRIVLSCFTFLLVSSMLSGESVRQQITLERNWKFTRGDFPEAINPEFSDTKWETVSIPHDWAIYGPFNEEHDLQIVAVEQNYETIPTRKTGRTGGLPYMGVGWYRTTFDVDGFVKGEQRVNILFDGAMSEAQVFINGAEVGFWPYGYNSFHFDITEYLNDDGKNNVMAVRLENQEFSSRWYPGAGLYRNVHLIVTNEVHVPVWGTFITTPHVTKEFASVKLVTELNNAENGQNVRVNTKIYDRWGKMVASQETNQKFFEDRPYEQHFLINEPELWTPESPGLYEAVSRIYYRDELVDVYTTRFGVRDIKFVPEKGFFLNGQRRKFQGVNNHHDLGPLGAAVNTAALRRQLVLLKDMGVDAIRTAHNMPTPELVELCDEMGFMVIVESFDEWDRAKVKNGYHRFFDEWAEKDLVNMIRNFRNNPSVIMWSIGNEVPTQCSPDGFRVAKFLQDICHREDPTRPVNCGMDRVSCVLDNGFAALIDIPGLNYRTHRYVETYERLPQRFVLGSETGSTVSSRGVYKFPPEIKINAIYDDHQSSSYDLEYCSWSNLPDEDFALADDYEWTMGQFVWTGFDYLGEPTPYDTDAWPSRSSLFGIIDLAFIPKDRFFLYRSVWNREDATLHILPHWNWEGREGEITPVFVYTNYPSAELFLNGKSQGFRTKNDSTLQHRYRLMWMDVKYEPGELKVVAYDEAGRAVAEERMVTAGRAHRIELIPDRIIIDADGKDLSYINVRVVDRDGNLVPTDSRLIRFDASGAGKYRASANGDPSSLELFHKPQMSLFNGQLTAIVQSGDQPGTIVFEAKAPGVRNARIEIQVK
ncbi:beta-galactosidase GalB [Natronoflexus pectinivorans]|uniref:Beta-galactosidase n=1 Tax=Natronoflexus pectinivorans TaxID=682526 RepID=A0A4R2GJF3_9BACT|nr:beta-galactosidase GalB [Natronoflexus pectinivorans]TCO08852.1 beta-galactosidase [Natronoflexus pectinivorans]